MPAAAVTATASVAVKTRQRNVVSLVIVKIFRGQRGCVEVMEGGNAVRTQVVIEAPVAKLCFALLTEQETLSTLRL
jgi:hypothetical protein